MGSIRQGAAAAVAYAVLAVVHTHPLILNLGSHLPGLGLGDNVSFVWNLWWMREALASRELDFFFCPLVFVPFGGALVLHTHTALAAFAGATFLSSLSVAEAQNVLLIASLALNGFATRLLALQITGSRSAAFAAGALFVVAPAVTVRMMGHYNLVLVWPLILACAAYITWLRNGTLPRSLGLGVVAALLPYTDYYYVVFFLIFAGVYLVTDMWSVDVRISPRQSRTLARTLLVLALLALAAAVAIETVGVSVLQIGAVRISVRTPTNALTAAWLLALGALIAHWRAAFVWTRRREHALPSLRHIAAATIVATLLTAPLAIHAWQLWRSGDYVTQSSALRSSPRGIDAASLILGPPFHGLAGPVIRDVYARSGIDAMEASAWLGAGVTGLLVLAVRRLKDAREIRQWTTIGAVFTLWALGPYLQVFGANTGALLPQAAARFVPVLNNARIPGRAMVVVTLAAMMLIAVVLAKAAPRRRSALWALVLLGLAESIAAPLPLSALPDSSLYTALASNEDRRAAVLPVPFGLRDGFGEQGLLRHDALYAQTVHRHALAGGFLARVSPKVRAWHETHEPYKSLLRLSTGAETATLPSCEEIVAGLRAAGIAYIDLDRHATAPALVAFVERQMPLGRVAGDTRHSLYKVAPERCGAVTTDSTGSVRPRALE